MRIHFLILTIVFVSCGEKTREETNDVDSTTLKSWQKKEIKRIPSDKYAPSKDTSTEEEVNPKQEDESDGQPFTIYKSKWSDDLDKENELYSKNIDEIIAEKQKQVTSNDGEMYFEYDLLNSKALAKLNTNALIYYCLAYPCTYSQNCTGFGYENEGVCFYPSLPSNEDAHTLTPIQRTALKLRKDSVSIVLNNYLKDRDTIEVEILSMIEVIQLYKMIPALHQRADFKKNTHCYTVLLSLMKMSNYKPYYNSTFYASTNNFDPRGIRRTTQKRADELKKLAMEFYDQLKK